MTGRVLLVLRLVVGDVRRHPGPAAMLVLSVAVATAVLSLGMSLPGVTERLYLQTRAATAGPDVVALAPGDDRAANSVLTSLENAPGVVSTSRPYRTFFATLTTDGGEVRAMVFGADAEPGPIDRPLVTSGAWVRRGGVVVEQGFARALGRARRRRRHPRRPVVSRRRDRGDGGPHGLPGGDDGRGGQRAERPGRSGLDGRTRHPRAGRRRTFR